MFVCGKKWCCCCFSTAVMICSARGWFLIWPSAGSLSPGSKPGSGLRAECQQNPISPSISLLGHIRLVCKFFIYSHLWQCILSALFDLSSVWHFHTPREMTWKEGRSLQYYRFNGLRTDRYKSGKTAFLPILSPHHHSFDDFESHFYVCNFKLLN